MQCTGGRVPHDVFQVWSRNRPESYQGPIVYRYTTVLIRPLSSTFRNSRGVADKIDEAIDDAIVRFLLVPVERGHQESLVGP